MCGPLVIRDLAEDEGAFLGEMLYAALDWRPGADFPPIEWVLAHPQAAIYHEGWGRKGDTALIAEEDGRLVGAVWYRLFTEAEHGDGYVDDETPEVGIAVVHGYRGRGIGRQLMEAVHERARRNGIGRIALSVDEGNPARRLYEALGYVDFEPEDGKGRMLFDLSAQATTR
jgi:GNAT superfamily N-acetyltransferase